MFLRLHLEGTRLGAQLWQEPPPDFDMEKHFVTVIEHFCNIVFFVEFLIRVYFFRFRFVFDEHINWFNMFDAMLVWVSICETYIFTSMSINVSYIRVVRVVRLLRTLQVVRTVRFFSNLRVLVSAVIVSFLSLFWSMVLLTLMQTMAALCLTQLLSSTILDEHSVTLPVREWVYRYYGTPSRSMYTVFEMTFSGCWPNYARTLVEDVSTWYVLFFVAYISGVVFAMFRIITAIFLRDTLAIANTDAESQIHAKMKEKEAYADKLLHFFEECDTCGDGIITEEEFIAMLKEPRAAAYLAYLELDSSESLNLFHIINDGGSGGISREEFVRGALRLKGFARAQDLVILLHEFYAVKQTMKSLERIARSTHADLQMFHSSSGKDPAPRASTISAVVQDYR